jgi:hypothetical protein
LSLSVCTTRIFLLASLMRRLDSCQHTTTLIGRSRPLTKRVKKESAWLASPDENLSRRTWPDLYQLCPAIP